MCSALRFINIGAKMTSCSSILIKDFDVIHSRKFNIAKNCLIMLHGYGSSKDDIRNIVPFFDKLDNTLFIIPNAPFLCDNSFGYQWFPIKLNEYSLDFDVNDCKQALEILNIFIKDISTNYNLPYSKIGLFGFSQGAILVLGLALLNIHLFSSIVAHSGLFFNYNKDIDKLNLNINNQQNILLIHGKKDNIVPFNYAQRTLQYFKQHDICAQTYFKNNLAHSVDIDTLNHAYNFFKKYW